MRVVITGASGFLGQALYKRLSKSPVEVIGLSRQSISGLVQVDSYSEAPAADVLIHLAEISDRRLANEQGIDYEQKSLDALKVLLKKKYHYILYASSAVLYGDDGTLMKNVDDAVHIVDTYTRLKWISEQLILNTGGAVARLVNLFGPGMASGNVLSTILSQLNTQGPVSLYNLSPIRDFLWIEDAAEALTLMAIQKHHGIFNIGTGVATSISELARAVLMAAGQENRKVNSVVQQTGPSHLVVDIEKTVNVLGWHPSWSLEKGIRKLVKISI